MPSLVLRVRLDSRTVAQLKDFASSYNLPLSGAMREALQYVLDRPDVWPAILFHHTPEACEDKRSAAQQEAWERDAVALASVDLAGLLADNDTDGSR